MAHEEPQRLFLGDVAHRPCCFRSKGVRDSRSKRVPRSASYLTQVPNRIEEEDHEDQNPTEGNETKQVHTNGEKHHTEQQQDSRYSDSLHAHSDGIFHNLLFQFLGQLDIRSLFGLVLGFLLGHGCLLKPPTFTRVVKRRSPSP